MYNLQKLLSVVERESLETKNLCLFVCRGNNILYRGLAVTHLITLLLKSLLLEELLKTALCNVLDHLLRKVGCLLCRNSLDDLACLLSLLWSEPAFCCIGLDVSLAVNMCRVDAGLVESRVYSLLNQLFLGLVDSDLKLVVDTS